MALQGLPTAAADLVGPSGGCGIPLKAAAGPSPNVTHSQGRPHGAQWAFWRLWQVTAGPPEAAAGLVGPLPAV